MNYYLSKFNEKFPNKEADNYVIFFKVQSFFESFFKGKEQLILFYNHTTAVGYIKISPLGVMAPPKLCCRIDILETSKKNEVIITERETYKGKYFIVQGFKEKNKEAILNRIIGGKRI